METLPPGSSQDQQSSVIRTAIACEPCRLRKTRCNIASSTTSACSECLKRHQAAKCILRERARPHRPANDKPGSRKRTKLSTSPASPKVSEEAAPRGAIPSDPADARRDLVSCVAQIEKSFMEIGAAKLGSGSVTPLTPPSEHIFPRPLSSQHYTLPSLGVIVGDVISYNRARHWIHLHFAAIHHNTPYLHLPHILELCETFFNIGALTPPDRKLGEDEMALFLAVLALGRFREEIWDTSTGKYRQLYLPEDGFCSGNSPEACAAKQTGATAHGLFQLALEELDRLEIPTEDAVQALLMLYTFVYNTSMGRRARDFIDRTVKLAKEVGLHRRAAGKETDSGSAQRRAILFLYVYFSDVYMASVDHHPPVIKASDFDPAVFDPILLDSTPKDSDIPTGLSGIAAFVDLVRTQGMVLERLHGLMLGRSEGVEEAGLVEHVLHMDTDLESLRRRLGSETFDFRLRSDGAFSDPATRAKTAGKLMRQIHFHWSRIVVRGPFLEHPQLRHSSLSICARSAVALLSHQEKICSTGLLNLPWMQLRRMSSAITLVFVALWEGELLNQEAVAALEAALVSLEIFASRWKTATCLTRLVTELAVKCGLQLRDLSQANLLLQPWWFDVVTDQSFGVPTGSFDNNVGPAPGSTLQPLQTVAPPVNFSADGPMWMGAGDSSFQMLQGWEDLARLFSSENGR